MKKKISALILIAVMLISSDLTVFATEYSNGVTTATTVTPEMTTASYWKALAGPNLNAVLMDTEAIKKFNSTALNCEETNMHDICSMDAQYDGTKLRDNLVADVLTFAENHDLFVNSVSIDRNTYVNAFASLITATGWTGTLAPKYAVATSTATLTAVPTIDHIGYSEMDFDNEAAVSSIVINEPFLVKQACRIANKTYYWGYSKNCSGWVDESELAFCATKKQWLDTWQTNLGGKDFIVITQDTVTLDPNIFAKPLSGLRLSLGATLKLVPQSQIPRNIAGRGSWNNYVVYIPTRAADGSLKQEIGLIAQKNSVSVGYLPMTQNNILDIAFSCLGNRYGWGGTADAMDCSMYTLNIYRCFGIEMPRNTTWQQKVPGTIINVQDYPIEQIAATISKAPAGTLLYMSGHAMVYLGTVNGMPYVISASGSISDLEPFDVLPIYSVVVTPLNVRRKNGCTWLENIVSLVNPAFINYN